MSTKYSGGFITKNPVAPTSSAASGIWTLDQQQQAQKAGTWPSPPIFIEDLFSTYLYTGNGATQTITNGIDVSGKGGLVWAKSRSDSIRNSLFDTARGANFQLSSNNDESSANVAPNGITFNSTGFTTGSFVNTNTNGATYVSWTLAEQPKFFDIVTYTGNGVFDRTISHNLGSVPAFIIMKCTSSAADWLVRTTAIDGSLDVLYLNKTDAKTDSSVSNTWTSSTFTVGASAVDNDTGQTYVAYLFASNAGGFPVSGGGSTNGISCGSYTGTGSTLSVTLGYEPQWVMIKRTDTTADWQIIDNMRGWTADGVCQRLVPNTSAAEAGPTGSTFLFPTATGFGSSGSSAIVNASGGTYIYIAIRRGPMKTPTVGTSVFDPEAYSGNNSNTRVITTGFPPDMVWTGDRANGSRRVGDRLRGLFINPGPISTTSSNSDEQFSSYSLPQMSGWQTGNGTVRFENSTGVDYVLHAFRRAPGFFDTVCYTGTGTPTNFTHNLGAVPELMIVKRRDSTSIWAVYAAPLASAASKYLQLNDTSAQLNVSVLWNDTAPTNTVFTIGASSNINTVGSTNVAYLFATVAGVSKVGSYTGTGALQTVNCGFTTGARFVLIKNASDVGNWYLYDSARGITSGDDPYLFINSSSVEVNNTNFVDTDTTGFKVTAAAPAGLNFSGDTYIFLAIA